MGCGGGREDRGSKESPWEPREPRKCVAKMTKLYKKDMVEKGSKARPWAVEV